MGSGEWDFIEKYLKFDSISWVSHVEFYKTHTVKQSSPLSKTGNILDFTGT